MIEGLLETIQPDRIKEALNALEAELAKKKIHSEAKEINYYLQNFRNLKNLAACLSQKNPKDVKMQLISEYLNLVSREDSFAFDTSKTEDPTIKGSILNIIRLIIADTGEDITGLNKELLLDLTILLQDRGAVLEKYLADIDGRMKIYSSLKENINPSMSLELQKRSREIPGYLETLRLKSHFLETEQLVISAVNSLLKYYSLL